MSQLTANCVAGQVAQRLMGAFVQVPGIPFEKPKKNGKDLIEEGIAAQVPAALIVMRISCAQTASTTNAAFSLCLSFCLFMLSILFQPVCIAHSLCAFLQLTVRTLTACAVHCACSRCRIHLCTHGGCRSKVPTPIGTRSQPALRNIDCEPSWNRC